MGLSYLILVQVKTTESSPKLIKIRPRKTNKLSSESKGTARKPIILKGWIITNYNKVCVHKGLKIRNSPLPPHHLLMISFRLLTHKRRIQISLMKKVQESKQRSLRFRHSLCCSIPRIQKNAKKSKNWCRNNTNKRKNSKKSRKLNTKSLWWKTSKRMKRDRRPYSL